MILVTRFDGSTFYINPELIRTIEHTPDTVITLTTDYKIVVRDSADAVLERFIDYQRKVRGDDFTKYLFNKIKEA